MSATIQVGDFVFQILQDNLSIQDEDLNHFKIVEKETIENMIYFRDSVYYISNNDKCMYGICNDWYFYLLNYGEDNKYDDYVIFLDLNEFYLNELKREIQKIKEITITTDPDEFKIIDQIFSDMNDSLNHLRDQDRIRFDIGEMMKWIHEFVRNYFSPF